MTLGLITKNLNSLNLITNERLKRMDKGYCYRLFTKQFFIVYIYVQTSIHLKKKRYGCYCGKSNTHFILQNCIDSFFILHSPIIHVQAVS